MAKKNFKGVPDDYATNPYPGWGVPSFKDPMQPEGNICFICGIDHTKDPEAVNNWVMSKNNPQSKNTPEPKSSTTSIEDIVEIMKQTYGVPYKPPVDPVLIKGKGGFWGTFSDTASTPDSTVPIKQIRIETRIEIPGYSDQKNGYKKHGFGVSMPEFSDITESQLRKILMDGFLKITDDIVKNMKEKNK